MKRAYRDHAVAPPVRPEVLTAMLPLLAEPVRQSPAGYAI